MMVKQKGIEFEVRKPDDSEQIGDCYMTMTGLVWCKGKTSKQKGVKISWDEFIEIMKPEGSKKAALKSAKST